MGLPGNRRQKSASPDVRRARLTVQVGSGASVCSFERATVFHITKANSTQLTREGETNRRLVLQSVFSVGRPPGTEINPLACALNASNVSTSAHYS